jgi:hypothetical protein
VVLWRVGLGVGADDDGGGVVDVTGTGAGVVVAAGVPLLPDVAERPEPGDDELAGGPPAVVDLPWDPVKCRATKTIATTAISEATRIRFRASVAGGATSAREDGTRSCLPAIEAG